MESNYHVWLVFVQFGFHFIYCDDNKTEKFHSIHVKMFAHFMRNLWSQLNSLTFEFVDDLTGNGTREFIKRIKSECRNEQRSIIERQ